MAKKQTKSKTKKSSHVIMKHFTNWGGVAWPTIHCVCEDLKTAKTECERLNSKAIHNHYVVQRVPFIAKKKSSLPNKKVAKSRL